MRALARIFLMFWFAGSVNAATGEMGTGKPDLGIYSAAAVMNISVWGLANPTISFPTGCAKIVLTPETMGMDTYKIAVATLLSARAMDKSVRFYAHLARDGGCGVDFVQLVM